MSPSGTRTGPTRVVCLGGGSTADYLCRALRPAIRDGRVLLTIVSRDNFRANHGFVPEMLAGKIQPGQVMSAARKIFAGARFFDAVVERIDVDARTVATSRLLDGREFILEYDHLVLALGSVESLAR